MRTSFSWVRLGRLGGLVLANMVITVGIHFGWSWWLGTAHAAQKPAAPMMVSEEEQIIRVSAKASPAVVSIVVRKPAPGASEPAETGSGTGFLVDAAGLIVTN